MRRTKRLIGSLTVLTLAWLPAAPAYAASDHTENRRAAGGGHVVNVPEGESIQDAIDSNPPGTRFQLTGTYSLDEPLVPKNGNVFLGPATIEAASGTDIGFDLKPSARNATIRNLEIRGFDLQGVECWLGATIVGSYIHHNERNGIGCGLENRDSNVTIKDNEIAYNGSDDEIGRGASGVKIARSGIPGKRRSGVDIRGNHVHDNIGVGLWCNIDCGGDRIRNNLTEDNASDGIQYETSLGPILIRNNVVRGNNTYDRGGHGGILVNSSRRANVTANTLENNARTGIRIRDDGRPYDVRRTFVHDNELNGNGLVGCGLRGVRCRDNH